MSSISGFPLCPIETSRGNRKWTRILSKCLTNRVNTIMNLRSLQVTEIYFSVCKRSVFKEIFDDSSEFHLLCLRIWIATDEMLYYFPGLRLYNSLSMRSWRLTRTQNWIRKGIRQSKGFTNRKFMLKQHIWRCTNIMIRVYTQTFEGKKKLLCDVIRHTINHRLTVNNRNHAL